MLRRKNNKRGVRIVYSSETIEKEVKMGKVEFLPGVSHTQVKAHVCKHDPHVCRSIPTYAKPQEQTCVSKNKAAYAASKLCMQALAHACKNRNRSSFTTFSSIPHPNQS